MFLFVLVYCVHLIFNDLGVALGVKCWVFNYNGIHTGPSVGRILFQMNISGDLK